MGQTDPDPGIPTVLWLMLGILLVILFAGGVMLVGHHTPTSVGPSAAAPAGAEQN